MLTRRQLLQGFVALGTGLWASRPLELLAQSTGVSPSTVESFRTRLQGSLLLPTDAGYTAAAALFNPRLVSRPALIVRCASPDDVATTVRWAQYEGLPLHLRAGGHNYEGFSTGPGVLLDVGSMRSVQFRDDKTVRIGAGTRQMEVYETLATRGVSLPAGSCPTVGICGYTLGGGFGLASRQHGLGIDSLVGLDLVDAQGRRVHCSERENPELFWACRGGGGGSFGVVTALDYRPFEVGEVAVFRLEWRFGDAARALRCWQAWAPYVDRRLTSVFAIREAEADLVYCTGMYLGSAGELKALLDQGFAGVSCSLYQVRAMSYMAAVREFAGGDDAPLPAFKSRSDYFDRSLSEKGIHTVLDWMQRAPRGAQSRIQFDAYGGAVNEVAATATAFPHRQGKLFVAQYLTYYRRPADETPCLSWSRGFFEAMRSHVTGGAYVNYCDLELTDWAQAYWGGNLPRLRAIKAVVDPKNVFRHAQSVRPA